MTGSGQQERHSPFGAEHEYAAVTGFLAQANGFRFTVLGLFLATAGFVLQQPARLTASLVLILSVLLWGAELRTRAILNFLMIRGRELESNAGNHAENPATARQFFAALETKNDQETWIGPPRRTKHGYEPRTFRLPPVVNHTLMIDLIYFVVALYCVLVLFLGPERF